MSYSYGRALQQSALKHWAKDLNDIEVVGENPDAIKKEFKPANKNLFVKIEGDYLNGWSKNG